MTRRKAKTGSGAWIVLAWVAIVSIGVSTHVAREAWPFLLIGMGVLGCIWSVARARSEVGVVLVSQAGVRPPVDLETMWPPTRRFTEPAKVAFGTREAGPALSVAAPLERSASPMPAMRVVEEPEFRITTLVESPSAIPSRPDRRSPGGRQATARWIPAGEAVTIHDLTIASGMIYVGAKLGDVPGRPEGCVIDPALPVARQGSASTDGMPYWPRYDAVSPGTRRAYLDWLAAGRSDADARIGLVFLFFYGLEYRLFKEAVSSDGPAIVAEVERLRARYGANASFQSYAGRFLEAARLTLPRASETRPDIVLDQIIRGLELPLDVRVWLGRRIAAGEPLDADDALLWLAGLPDRSFRTPVARCPDEFQALWHLRFAERYPGGLKVVPPKTRLKATYRAASGTFEVPIRSAYPDLPDIGSISGPIRKLRDLVEACTTELDGYSRFMGKRPDARTSTEAALLLPHDLDMAGTAWEPVRARVDELLGGRDTATVRLDDLFAAAGLSLLSAGRIPQPPMVQLGQVLDRIDIAFEPDRRYGGPLPDISSIVCLFRAADGAPVDLERPEYRTARDLIDIACLAAASDGTIERTEIEAVLATLRASATLTPSEKARLEAYALSIAKDPPKQQAVLKRAAGRSLAERRGFADAALAAVMADGQVTPSEVKFLERLHKALDLPADGIYTGLHRGGGPGTTTGSEGASFQPAPNVPQAPSGAVTIDAARLERIRRETQAVSNLLSDIFIDEVPPVASAPSSAADPDGDEASSPEPIPGPRSFPGLDPAHAELLAALLALPDPIGRGIFDTQARARRLLPDGALETINEWAFDRFGDALLEGEDDLDVAPHLRDRLSEREAA